MEIRYSKKYIEDDSIDIVNKVKITTTNVDIVPNDNFSLLIIFDTEGASHSIDLPQNNGKIVDISTSHIDLETPPNAIIVNRGYSGFIVPRVNWILDNTL